MKKDILDATCGGRTIWIPENKDREDVLYIDKREEQMREDFSEDRKTSIEKLMEVFGK